ncbi:hypothetical protein CAEBREN_19800 [Caenorhabditis brenneri]|uniref:F-box domain-containing protein n=1 Tax=Caenorhabditis brenneri TaxID=135651 RepID=G0N0G8_CAEBE|nr:hypothetical protein CAEBREN_19800 [Caenorhabditis brenneri]
MAATPTFPLLALPDDEILQTIRVMDLEQIIKFSLISERCKDLVKSIRIKGTSLTVSVKNQITISIATARCSLDLTFYLEPDMYWGMGAHGRKKKLTPPQSVVIDKDAAERQARQPSEWKKRDFTMNAWLKHLKDIFHYHKIHSLRFGENSFEFDIDDIKEVFGNKTEICIQNTGCLAFNQMILQHFFPIEELTIMAENFQDSDIPPSLLMQNHATLYIRESDLDVPITLNDLLLINSKVIIVDSLHIPPNELNKFIKLWQKGSNLRMEYLFTDHFNGEEDDEEIVMKGIEYEENPLDRVRNFKAGGFEDDPIQVYGGMDIYRKDGMKATVAHRMYHESSFWEMFVWMDHCVVE